MVATSKVESDKEKAELFNNYSISVLLRDQSILLLFSPIFLSSKSFFPTYYAQYFAHQLIC